MKKKLVTVGLACIAVGSASVLFAADGTEVKTCQPSGNLKFICGMENPEDLAVLPGERWIIASGMAAKSGLHLIDAANKTGERWIASTNGKPKAPFDRCPSQPPPDELQIHGISLRNDKNGRGTLYAVNHGGKGPIQQMSVGRGRETIEVFDITARGAKPMISWKGCVALPGKLVANSVVSGSDGAIYATVMLHPDNQMNDLFGAKPTGAVYKWEPGKPEFERIEGTQLAGNNGIELSRDGKALYVGAVQTLTKFSNTSPAVRLKSIRLKGGWFDNIHWVGSRLIATGPRTDLCPPASDGVPCAKGYRVMEIDPETLNVTVIAEGEGIQAFSVASTGVFVGKTLWLGSYAADRAAYRSLP